MGIDDGYLLVGFQEKARGTHTVLQKDQGRKRRHEGQCSGDKGEQRNDDGGQMDMELRRDG